MARARHHRRRHRHQLQLPRSQWQASPGRHGRSSRRHPGATAHSSRRMRIVAPMGTSPNAQALLLTHTAQVRARARGGGPPEGGRVRPHRGACVCVGFCISFGHLGGAGAHLPGVSRCPAGVQGPGQVGAPAGQPWLLPYLLPGARGPRRSALALALALPAPSLACRLSTRARMRDALAPMQRDGPHRPCKGRRRGPRWGVRAAGPESERSGGWGAAGMARRGLTWGAAQRDASCMPLRLPTSTPDGPPGCGWAWAAAACDGEPGAARGRAAWSRHVPRPLSFASRLFHGAAAGCSSPLLHPFGSFAIAQVTVKGKRGSEAAAYSPCPLPPV